jgi:hypothetical protein
MAIAGTVYGLGEQLRVRTTPAVTRWNRLEGRPRSHDFERALKAEVRDALWMLTKQWQLGEFRGDDAGSPVLARICTGATQFDRFQPGAATVEPFPTALPLETVVERRPISWQSAGRKLSLDLRLVLGRRWRKMLAKAASAATPVAQRLGADYWPEYLKEYAVAVPDPSVDADAPICAHADVWQQVRAVAERTMDGYALLEHIDTGGAAADNIAGASGDAARLAALAQRLRDWLSTVVEQPADPAHDSWQPDRLEYRFACAAPDGVAGFHAAADEYYTGRLDWYSLDRDRQWSDHAAPPGPQPALSSSTFIPTSLVFSGMPNTRWWQFEERQTNFGHVRPDTTDLGKLLLLDFGLQYANDWFVFPYTLPLGSIATVKGIALTNVFGERIWIEPVPDQGAAAWDRWSMFQLTGNDERALVLMPSTPFVLEGASLEEVAMVRDEMANLVFGIETRVPMVTGTSKPGGEAGREFLQAMQRIQGAPPAPPTPVAAVRFQLMNTVPEHWIPFLPVHVAGSTRETQLQRGAMPRMVGADPTNFKPVEPRTSILRPGLDRAPKAPYFVHEEEVPRAGVRVTVAYQRSRWLDGRVFVWLGASKATGRGEASSGLAFDQLVPTDFKPPDQP